MTKLFQIADLHFGTEDRHLVDAFVDLCNASRPDAVIAAARGRKSEPQRVISWRTNIYMRLRGRLQACVLANCGVNLALLEGQKACIEWLYNCVCEG